jgi:hypothetical protein
MVLKYSINALINNYKLLSESQKKIARYNDILTKYTKIDKNVYTKIELYTKKITELTTQIEKDEKYIINVTEQIIKYISKYITNPENNIYIQATSRYKLLKSLKSVETNMDEQDLTNQIDEINQELISTENEINLIKKENKKLDSLLISILNYQKTSSVDSTAASIITTQIENDINTNKEKIIILEKKYNELQSLKYKKIDDKLLITTDFKYLEKNFVGLYYNICEDTRDLHEMNIPLLIENKSFDRNRLTNGKYFLSKYIKTYHPDIIENYEKFLNHFEVLETAYKNSY